MKHTLIIILFLAISSGSIGQEISTSKEEKNKVYYRLQTAHQTSNFKESFRICDSLRHWIKREESTNSINYLNTIYSAGVSLIRLRQFSDAYKYLQSAQLICSNIENQGYTVPAAARIYYYSAIASLSIDNPLMSMGHVQKAIDRFETAADINDKELYEAAINLREKLENNNDLEQCSKDLKEENKLYLNCQLYREKLIAAYAISAKKMRDEPYSKQAGTPNIYQFLHFSKVEFNQVENCIQNAIDSILPAINIYGTEHRLFELLVDYSEDLANLNASVGEYSRAIDILTPTIKALEHNRYYKISEEISQLYALQASLYKDLDEPLIAIEWSLKEVSQFEKGVGDYYSYISRLNGLSMDYSQLDSSYKSLYFQRRIAESLSTFTIANQNKGDSLDNSKYLPIIDGISRTLLNAGLRTESNKLDKLAYEISSNNEVLGNKELYYLGKYIYSEYGCGGNSVQKLYDKFRILLSEKESSMSIEDIVASINIIQFEVLYANSDIWLKFSDYLLQDKIPFLLEFVEQLPEKIQRGQKLKLHSFVLMIHNRNSDYESATEYLDRLKNNDPDIFNLIRTNSSTIDILSELYSKTNYDYSFLKVDSKKEQLKLLENINLFNLKDASVIFRDYDVFCDKYESLLYHQAPTEELIALNLNNKLFKQKLLMRNPTNRLNFSKDSEIQNSLQKLNRIENEILFAELNNIVSNKLKLNKKKIEDDIAIQLGENLSLTIDEPLDSLPEDCNFIAFSESRLIKDRKLQDSTIYSCYIHRNKKLLWKYIMISSTEKSPESILNIDFKNSIASILESFKKGSIIYYTCEGIFNQINISSLVLANNEYATEVYDLRLLSDITNVGLSLNNSDIDTINLFGGLDYHKSEKTDLVRLNQFGLLNTLTRQYNVSQSSLDWPHLPATLKEVNDISKVYNLAGYYSNITSGSLATEETVRNMSGRSPNVLHFATHGFFFGSENLNNNNKYSISENPLHRSGLVLSLANDSKINEASGYTNDGILTAYEISRLDLRKTNLAVLSACKTALGDIDIGDGVYGLQRGLKLAGVNFIIMSLWEVPDKETMEFMTIFYREMLKSNDIYKGFKSAQNQMILKYRNQPKKWAGFVLMN